MVIQNLDGNSCLGRHLCSLRVCKPPSQDLLVFTVSGEKSGVILIGLPLSYLTVESGCGSSPKMALGTTAKSHD